MHLAVWPGWSGHDNGLAARYLRWDGHHERAAGQNSCAAGHIQAHCTCNTRQPPDEHALHTVLATMASTIELWLCMRNVEYEEGECMHGPSYTHECAATTVIALLPASGMTGHRRRTAQGDSSLATYRWAGSLSGT